MKTIADHFRSVRNLSRTNNLKIPNDDMIVGVLYGEKEDLSGHYRRISKEYDYEVVIGKDFWHRLTGDENFYYELIKTIGLVATEADFSKDFERIVQTLAASKTIQSLGNPD